MVAWHIYTAPILLYVHTAAYLGVNAHGRVTEDGLGPGGGHRKVLFVFATRNNVPLGVFSDAGVENGRVLIVLHHHHCHKGFPRIVGHLNTDGQTNKIDTLGLTIKGGGGPVGHGQDCQ